MTPRERFFALLKNEFRKLAPAELKFDTHLKKAVNGES